MGQTRGDDDGEALRPLHEVRLAVQFHVPVHVESRLEYHLVVTHQHIVQGIDI